MRSLKESLLDIDDNINDDSIIYYNTLKKSYGEHRLDSKVNYSAAEANRASYFKSFL